MQPTTETDSSKTNSPSPFDGPCPGGIEISDEEFMQIINLAKDNRIKQYMHEGGMSKAQATALADEFYAPANKTVAELDQKIMASHLTPRYNW